MHIIILIVSFLFLTAPISNVAHEVGHMIGAFIVKADHMHLSIGKGKRVVTFTFKKLKVTLRRLYFTGGQAESMRYKAYLPIEMVFITIMGPLMNLLCAFIFYLLFQVHPTDIILLFILFNVWLGLGNLIPFKFKQNYSDGYMILKILFKGCLD